MEMNLSESLFALIGFAAWTLFLLSVFVLYRVANVLTGRYKADEFPATTAHGALWYQRIIRAHMNCVETLPVFAAIILTANFVQHHELADQLACWFLGARIIQSFLHLISVHHLIVHLRFTAFLVQLIIMGWIITDLVQWAVA